MVADWVELTNHGIEQWKKRTPDDTRIGPRIAWSESILVPTGFWENRVRAVEVWLHEPTDMLLIFAENEYPGYDDPVLKTTYQLLEDVDWHRAILDWAHEGDQ